jgi:hypothetical protein
MGALIGLSFGSTATLLAQFGDTFTMQVVVIVWTVLFLACVMVIRQSSDA